MPENSPLPNPPASPPDSPPAGVATLIKRMGPASVLAVGAMVLPVAGSALLFWKMGVVGPWLREQGDLGVVIYTLGFVVLAGLALLPTYATAILGGWAFGFGVGFPASLVGFLGGALLAYAICRATAGDRVEDIIDEKPTWRAVRDALVGSGFWRTLLIVTLVRIPPNSPFAVTNLVMASVKVKLVPYVLGTLIGMAPRTGLVVFLAVKLRDKLATDAATADTPWWYIALGIALTIIVLVVLGKIGQAAVKRVTRAKPTP